MLTLFTLLSCFFQTTPQTSHDLATVVIFQAGRYGDQEFDLLLNDESVLTPFKKNTSITFKINPGEIDIKLKRTRYLQSDNHYVMEVEAGSTYYLKASLEYEFPTTGLALSVENSEQYQKVKHKLNKVFLNVTASNEDN